MDEGNLTPVIRMGLHQLKEVGQKGKNYSKQNKRHLLRLSSSTQSLKLKYKPLRYVFVIELFVIEF